MPIHNLATHLLMALAVAGLVLPAAAQNKVHLVSPKVDDKSAPAAGSIAGFGWGLRQQILIDEWRLAGVKGKKLRGLILRRDLDYKAPLRGGDVDLEVRLSPAPHDAAHASSEFGGNQAGTVVTVFDKVLTLPTSNAVGTSANAWGPGNAVRIDFETAYDYARGPLCIELLGRPVPGKEPEFWSVDHEWEAASGSVVPHGRSCSVYASGGVTLSAEETGLEIGSTVRLIGFGRPGASPMLLIGTRPIPTGLSLAPIGAPGCEQLVEFFALIPLVYHAPRVQQTAAFANFTAQIPANRSMRGSSLFFQSVDIETGLPRPWSNPAGLTTSNGLELRIATATPGLGMAVVRSPVLAASGPEPAFGSVDVGAAPVLRVVYSGL